MSSLHATSSSHNIRPFIFNEWPRNCHTKVKSFMSALPKPPPGRHFN